MATKEKYRKVTDLYTLGQEIPLRDGTIIYVKALNSFEQQEARSDAQAARARMTLALKEFGSDEMTKLEAKTAAMGREAVIAELLDNQQGEWLVKAVNEVQDDPEWAERIELMQRDPEDTAVPMSDEEKQLLNKINTDYMAELNQRMDNEREYAKRRLEGLSEEQLRDEFRDLWVDRRGGESAMAEYRLTEVWYAARECDAELVAPGVFDHGQCNGHQTKVWETRQEVRAIPDELFELISNAVMELNMPPREGKDSGSQASSSDSSALPSEEEGSTPSTQDETPSELLGTSASP